MTDRGLGAWIEEALRAFEGPLLRYATRFCRNRDEARDVVQETFLRLCEADRIKVEGHLRAWLFTVCRTRILDAHRRRKPMDSLEASPLISGNVGPADAAERREGAHALQVALADLDPLRREVLLLKFEEGLSYREISEVTGKSVSHVGVLIHEGVLRMRKALGEGRAQ